MALKIVTVYKCEFAVDLVVVGFKVYGSDHQRIELSLSRLQSAGFLKELGLRIDGNEIINTRPLGAIVVIRQVVDGGAVAEVTGISVNPSDPNSDNANWITARYKVLCP